jgi:hypothetical protein
MPQTRPVALSALFVVILALGLLPRHLESQALEPGSRVRLTQASGARHQGILHAIETDSVRLTGARGGLVAVSLADVERVEVSLGRRRQFWKHLGMTAVGLALVGGGVAASTYEPCNEDVLFGCLMEPESRGEAFFWGAIVGGAVGVPAGVVVGAAVRQEQWQPVNHPAVRPRQVSIRPIVGNRIGASATLVF